MEKILKRIVLIISVILITFILTNPDTDAHKDALKVEMYETYDVNEIDSIIDLHMKRDNHIIFSTIKINDNELGFGILGKVFIYFETIDTLELN